MAGFIPIKRSLFDHFLFKERRAFSRFEAWLDLIQLATFQEENRQVIKGKVIVCQKGQLIASIRFLETRWLWSKHKVCDYIEVLRSQQMLSVDIEDGVSRITLLNFKKHNELAFTDSERDEKGDTKRRASKGKDRNQGTQNDTEKGTLRGHSGDTQGTNLIKDNKGNEGEEYTASAGSLSPEDRFKNFQTWIEENAPQVNKMKSPFTMEQYLTVRKMYELNDITDVLLAMENKKTLLKDYTSAYLTCNNWLKMRESSGKTVKKDGSESKSRQSKAEALGAAIASGLPPAP